MEKSMVMSKLEALGGVILQAAKEQGVQYAQCTVSEREKREFNVDGGSFSLMRTLFDRDVIITVLKDQKKGSVRINRFDEDAVLEAVRECVASSESAEADDAWAFADSPVEKDFLDGEPECDLEALFDRSRELMDQIREKHPKILMEQMITEHDRVEKVFMSTNSVKYRTLGGCYHFSLMYSAHDGEKSSSFFGSDVTLSKLDRPILECAMIEKELSAIEQQLDTQPLEGKFTGTAVLAPAAMSEIVLSTILDNYVSDSSLIDATSIWEDSLGQKVADERFSMSMTPYADYVVMGDRYTSEGFVSEGFDIIRNGILKSFDLSQYGANKTGNERAKCEGWNLTVESGDTPLEQIISSIDRGVLVLRFSGGQPAASGEFSGVAKNSFLIENGKVTHALSEVMVSGCVRDMLKNVRAISQETLRDGTVSIPYIAFDGVTISGK
ncbi:MAG: TldD/PmbA family protein [Clostridia bacterium]|nr:TldD/PmbA family protein [Clostridia bacterium]